MLGDWSMASKPDDRRTTSMHASRTEIQKKQACGGLLTKIFFRKYSSNTKLMSDVVPRSMAFGLTWKPLGDYFWGVCGFSHGSVGHYELLFCKSVWCSSAALLSVSVSTTFW